MQYARLEVPGEERTAWRLLHRCRCTCGVLKTVRIFEAERIHIEARRIA